MNTQHTPGPWTTDEQEHDAPYQCIKIKAGPHRTICTVWIDDAPVHDFNAEQEVNARLIAAAPDLLAIVKGLVGMLENCSVESGVCCCGEDMERHSSAMMSGHTPVDSGAYYAESLLKDVRSAITKVTGSTK